MNTATGPFDDDGLSFSEFLLRLRRGLRWTIGLGLIGLSTGLLLGVIVGLKQPVVTSLRLSFGFPGAERALYPNGTKFQPDDIRASDIVIESLKRLGIGENSPDLATKIRGAIGVTGFVSPNIIKERDRLRAAGQTLSPFVPDEYELSLSLPRQHVLSVRQRELFLAELTNAFLEKFRRTYADLPVDFGNAFASLQNADFMEYELVLNREMHSLRNLLEQFVNETGGFQHASHFRSPTNNLSFEDLLKQTQLFSDVRLNSVLSQIYTYGLSKDRAYALLKMDYDLRTLEDQENRLKEEEAVVSTLLDQTRERGQNYVVASKAQLPQGNQPILDQAFIDSLLANDAYNFLVRRALEAGLAVKRVQAERARQLERRQRIEAFAKEGVKDQAAIIASTEKSLAELEGGYQDLLQKIRVVLTDYSRQEFADAVRITMQPRTSSMLEGTLLGAGVGVAAGIFLGLGLSLVRSDPRPPTS